MLSGPAYKLSDLAGFWRRTAAVGVDLLLIAFAIGYAPEAWYQWAPPEWVTLESYIWVDLAATLAGLFYFVGMRLFTRGSIGYRLVGIRYAYALDGRPPWYALAYRAFTAAYLMWIFALDHFWILFDERKQAWHDKVSGFYVVRRRAVPCGSQPMVRRVVNFMMLSFEVWEPLSTKTGIVPSATAAGCEADPV